MRILTRGGGAVGELVERGPEVDALRHALARAADGSGATVVVLGPPGIGKSALLRTVPGTPLRARGGELEREFPYGVVRQLFEQPVRRLDPAARAAALAGPAGVLAPLLLGGTGADPGDAYALEHGLYRLTAHLAELGPVVISVDDAHWADLPSLRALLYLTRRIADLPVALVVASRRPDGPHRPLVDRLALEATAVLEPQPLSAAGVGELVHRELAAADDPFCVACHAASGGNPFLVTEVIDAVRAQGWEPSGGNAGRVRGVGARSVARSVLLRLGALSPAAAAVARTLAVLGPAPRPDVLAELSGVAPAGSPDDLVAALDELRDAHLIGPEDPPAFVHGIVRDAVYDDLGAPERSDRHLAAAHALARAGAAAETVAGHLLPTRPGTERWVVDRLVEAASGPGAAISPEAVAAYLDRALREVVTDLDPAPLLLALGGARFQTVGGDAASPLAEARRLARTPELRVDATRALASAYMTELRVDRAWAVVEETLADLPGRPDLVRDLEIFSAPLLYADAPAEVVDALLRRTRAWRPDPTGATAPDRSMLALQAWTTACAATPAGVAAGRARAALSTGTLVHDDVWSVSVDLAVWSLVADGCHREALDHLDAAVGSCRARGQRLRAATLLPARADVRRRLGDLPGALDDARLAVEVVTGEQIYAPLAAAALVTAHVDAGDPAPGWAVLEHYGFDADIAPGGMTDVLWFARGRLRIAAGDVAGGVEDLLVYGQRCARRGRHHPGLFGWRSTAVAPLVGLGRADEAAVLAAEELRLATATGRPELAGRARLALGLARTEPVGPELVAAVEAVTASDLVLDAAAARLTLGRMLRREGRRIDAREQLRAAADVAARVGAAGIAAAAREELVATGARPRRAAATGVDALTPSESRVAALAAQGLTNREIAHSLFVTPKTIETHLAGAYRKLGIAAKSELAAALALG